MTEQLTRDMIEAARVVAESTDAHWTDQMNKPAPLAAYHRMADELWAGLRAHNPGVQIVAVEPAESPVLSGGAKGSHKFDGIGAGYIVPLWQPEIADAIEFVSTDEAVAMAKRLAREEGLFAGTSTGASVIAALRLAERLGPEAAVVTLMCDTGMKYLRSFGVENGSSRSTQG